VLETHLPQERNKVQAFNDFLVFGMMAIGSFLVRPVARQLRLVGGEPRGLSAGAARPGGAGAGLFCQAAAQPPQALVEFPDLAI